MEPKLKEEQYSNLTLDYSGLGGWLVLVQIGLYFGLINLLVQLFQYSLPAVAPETWNMITSKDSEFYHPLWRPLLTFELTYNILFLLFIAYILINFYRKKSIVPRLMIISYIVTVVVGIIDTAILNQIPMAAELEDGSSYREIFKSLVTCAIWIPYFLKSERVKNTFIR